MSPKRTYNFFANSTTSDCIKESAASSCIIDVMNCMRWRYCWGTCRQRCRGTCWRSCEKCACEQREPLQSAVSIKYNQFLQEFKHCGRLNDQKLRMHDVSSMIRSSLKTKTKPPVGKLVGVDVGAGLGTLVGDGVGARVGVAFHHSTAPRARTQPAPNAASRQ